VQILISIVWFIIPTVSLEHFCDSDVSIWAVRSLIRPAI